MTLVTRVLPRVRQMLLVAAGGYAVVGLFGAAYAVISAGWTDLSASATATIAALVAAPLALALLWSRLAGFKAFGFEVSLSQATAEIEAEVAAAITSQQYFSGAQHIIDQLKVLIVRSDTELIEVNLRDGDYWWSSRLYLLAALADDFSNVRQFVFVEHGPQRAFVGMATTGAVRGAMAAELPSLEVVYAGVKLNQQAASPDDRVASIVNSWAASQFEHEGQQRLEEHLPRVTKDLLHDALAKVGRRLATDSVDWTRVSDPQLVRALLLDFESQHVALLRGGRLDRVVNRFELAERVAERAIA